MNYIIHYDYAAIGVILFTIFFLVTRKDMRKPDNKVMLWLTVVNLVAAIADIVALNVQSDPEHMDIRAGIFWNELHLTLHTQMGTLLLLYIIVLLGIRHKIPRALMVLFFFPSAVELFIILTNPFTKWYFYYNEHNIYSYGPLVGVVFAIPLIQILIVMILTIRYRHVLEKNMLSAMCIFYVITMLAILIQFLHHELLIELFTEALGFLGMLLAIDNKDEIHSLVEAMDELKAERQRADEANRAKSDFLANMSHEIRTPINAVLGMNEMVLRDVAEAEKIPARTERETQKTYADIAAYAADIRSAGNNLLSIINDILDFSKIESGKMELVEHPYHLSVLLNDISNLFMFRAEEKNLSYTLEAEESLPDGLYGDDVRITQIMTNLLSNAFKYTKEGAVTVTVDALSEEEEIARARRSSFSAAVEAVWLRIRVKDTGIGIRKADMDKLFEQFERIELQKNYTTEGTGLGLAITKSLVDMMRGTITVESEYGKGSVFTVMLPQKVTDHTRIGAFRKTALRHEKRAQDVTDTYLAPEATVLAVDDTPVNLTVIEHLLRRTEMHVVTALSGAEALALCKESVYDVILMDQRMPGMDGTKTLHAIREQDGGKNHDTPVICLTANVVKGAREHYLEEGFADYLSKPVEGVQLEQMIRKYLPEEKILAAESDREDAVINLAEFLYEGEGAGASTGSATGTATDTEPVEVPGADADDGVSAASATGTATDTEPVEVPEADTDIRMTAGQYIENETPRLLQEYRALAEALRGIFPDSDGAKEPSVLPEMSMEDLHELYEAVSEFAEMYDSDSIKRLLHETDGFSVPEAEREHFHEIKKYADASDWENLTGALP